MKLYHLTAKEREISTKGTLNQFRSQGLIPAVVYGKDGNANLFCFINDLKHLIYTGDVYKVQLKVGEKEYQTIVREVQYDPMNDLPKHIDFMEVEDSKEVILSYPVLLTGAPVGVKAGGKLYRKLRMVTLKGKIGNMPDHVQFDVSGLDIGNTLKIKDVSIPGIEIMESPTTPIANVSRTRATEGESAEGGAEAAGEAKPEGEKKSE